MKKKFLKLFIIMIAICLTLITLSSTKVQAALQSNPNTHYTAVYDIAIWMKYFRNMEKSGEALGLSETIDETTMLATSKSNNLDSHMVKSTEYGAAIILSVSGYGNTKTLQESTIKTTTGNETGVYFSELNYESVAGGLDGIFSGVNSRYYNVYTDSTSAKVGDALGTASTINPGCLGWHSSPIYHWPDGAHPAILRGYSGLFSIDWYYSYGGFNSRGVVVCGEGL